MTNIHVHTYITVSNNVIVCVNLNIKQSTLSELQKNVS